MLLSVADVVARPDGRRVSWRAIKVNRHGNREGSI